MNRKDLSQFVFFLFSLQIFECTGWAKVSCYTSEALKDELIQNVSLLWSSLTDDDQITFKWKKNRIFK